MGRRPRSLTVRITPNASNQLDEIWAWNAKTYGAPHADRYIEFLVQETHKLAATYRSGRIVPARPEYRHVLIRKGKKNSHGHIAVYWVTDHAIEVVHYFHTAQDWQTSLGSP